jgi:hypothetical protein
MKAKTRVILAVMFAAMLPWQIWALGRKDTAQDPTTPRGLYVNKTADAMRVQVLDIKTGASVSPSQEFTKDDKLKLVVESNFEGHVYIVNVEMAKKGETRFLLYPNPQVTNNKIKPKEPLELSVGLDENPATEVLQVIASHDRIEYLNSALNGKCSESESRCQLDAKTAARVAAIAGNGKSAKSAGGIFARPADRKQNNSGVRPRDIILSSGKEDADATYVAIPVSAGGEGRLKSKEVFVFEIRLKHK